MFNFFRFFILLKNMKLRNKLLSESNFSFYRTILNKRHTRQIVLLIKKGDYSVNHLHHYTFTIDGKFYIYSIVEIHHLFDQAYKTNFEFS